MARSTLHATPEMVEWTTNVLDPKIATALDEIGAAYPYWLVLVRPDVRFPQISRKVYGIKPAQPEYKSPWIVTVPEVGGDEYRVEELSRDDIRFFRVIMAELLRPVKPDTMLFESASASVYLETKHKKALIVQSYFGAKASRFTYWPKE